MTQAIVLERVFLKSCAMGSVMVQYTSTGKVEAIPFDDDKLAMIESCMGRVCYITLDSCGVISSLIPITTMNLTHLTH